MRYRHLIVAAVMAVFALSGANSLKAHPHDELETFEVKGTLSKVDVMNRAIEVDTVDRATKAPRNLVLFVDKKVKIRNGKARLELAQLQQGQRVTCSVERAHHDGQDDRLTVFEIRVDPRS